MNAARVFTVETVVSKACIISEIPEVAGYIAQEYQSRGIDVDIFEAQQFLSVSQSNRGDEYDYYIFLGVTTIAAYLTLPEYRQGWQSFVEKIGRHVPVYICLPAQYDAYIGNFGSNYHVFFYSEYIGKERGIAPTLDGFLRECGGKHTLTLPGDGLAPYSLLTIEDIEETISKFIFSNSSPAKFYLAPKEPISILSFAYQLRSVVPFRLEIKFADDIPNPPSVDGEKIKESQAKMGSSPSGDYMNYLPAYVGSHLKMVSIKEPAPDISPQEHVGQTEKTTIANRQGQAAYGVRAAVTKNQSPVNSKKSESLPVFVPIEVRRKPHVHLKPLIAHVKNRKPRLSHKYKLIRNSFFVAVSLYIFTLIVAGTITFLTARSLVQSVNNHNFVTARTSTVAKPPAIYLQANLTFLMSLPGVGRIESLRSLNQLMSAYVLALDTSAVASDIAVSGKNIAAYVLGEGEGNIVGDLNVARLQINDMYDKLSLLDGALPSEVPSVVPARYKESYISAKNRIGDARHAVLTSKSLLAVAPSVLGVGDRRKYVILLQNNMELRATGGFIGSFAVVSLENGKLFDEQVYDVYSADGQLKGHVEPPEEIKKYLGEANWYMRDSNWDPDFPTTGRRVEWFLNKTLSQDVQGVIGLNLFTLQDIMRSIGSSHLDDYNEDISADNLFERAEYHAEVNFFPGSTAKKEFLGSLTDVLINKLKSLSPNQLLSVMEAISGSIEEKNTVMAFADSGVDRTFSALGWNGEIREVPCPDLGVTCSQDYAMLVDSNFGVNKANYFVKRNIALDVKIEQDFSVSHTLKVEYTNTAKSSAWPAGPYKNYSRIYLPLGSTVSSVQIGSTILKKDDIKLSTEHNRTIAGFLVEVPLDSTIPVIVVYATPSSLSNKGSGYSLYWQKQPGTSPDSLKVHVSYPTSLEPEIVSPKATFEPGSLGFALSNVTDRRVTIKFK
jgi:hypothetical protein